MFLSTFYAAVISSNLPKKYATFGLSYQSNFYFLVLLLLFSGFRLWQKQAKELDDLLDDKDEPDINASIESAYEEHLYGAGWRSNQVVVKLKIWNQGDDKGFVSNVKLYGEITNTRKPYELQSLSNKISTQDILKRDFKELDHIPREKPTFPLEKGEPVYKEYLFLLPSGVFLKPKKIGIYRQDKRDVFKLDLKDSLPTKETRR